MDAKTFAVIADLIGPMPDFITSDWLTNLWSAAEAKKCNGCPILMELHWITENAEACVKWMLEKDIKSCKYIGPFRKNPFSRGQTVVIPKGAKIWYRGKDVVTKKSYKVKVHMTSEGYINNYHGLSVHNPRITWPGSGGYWTDLDLGENSDLEISVS